MTEATVAMIVSYCPKLNFLDLSFCPRMTDAAIRSIRTSCKNLKVLKLEGISAISDLELQKARDVFEVVDFIEGEWMVGKPRWQRSDDNKRVDKRVLLRAQHL
jgi:hypothetical protein